MDWKEAGSRSEHCFYCRSDSNWWILKKTFSEIWKFEGKKFSDLFFFARSVQKTVCKNNRNLFLVREPAVSEEYRARRVTLWGYFWEVKIWDPTLFQNFRSSQLIRTKIFHFFFCSKHSEFLWRFQNTNCFVPNSPILGGESCKACDTTPTGKIGNIEKSQSTDLSQSLYRLTSARIIGESGHFDKRNYWWVCRL